MQTDGQVLHHHDEHHHDMGEIKVFGFWIYILNDCILFASIFATYAVLQGNTAGGPSARDIFDLQFVLVETFFLLVSSVTYGFAILCMHKHKVAQLQFWLFITLLCGLGFIAMELWEFNHLIHQGFGPQRSGFLSAFFGLVGTHGVHVTFGIIWLILMMFQISQDGISETNQTRLMCLSLFWHFLDVVWICVFSVVYLLGAL